MLPLRHVTGVCLLALSLIGLPAPAQAAYACFIERARCREWRDERRANAEVEQLTAKYIAQMDAAATEKERELLEV